VSADDSDTEVGAQWPRSVSRRLVPPTRAQLAGSTRPTSLVPQMHKGSDRRAGLLHGAVLVGLAQASSDGAPWARLISNLLLPELHGFGLGGSPVRLSLTHCHHFCRWQQRSLASGCSAGSLIAGGVLVSRMRAGNVCYIGAVSRLGRGLRRSLLGMTLCSRMTLFSSIAQPCPENHPRSTRNMLSPPY
jgi:hypothetical protein